MGGILCDLSHGKHFCTLLLAFLFHPLAPPRSFPSLVDLEQSIVRGAENPDPVHACAHARYTWVPFPILDRLIKLAPADT